MTVSYGQPAAAAFLSSGVFTYHKGAAPSVGGKRAGDLMTCRIEHFVRESVASLEEDKTVQEAVELMADHNADSLVVTRKGRVVGLFTERDLVKRVVGPGKQPSALKLKDVATTTCLIYPLSIIISSINFSKNLT